MHKRSTRPGLYTSEMDWSVELPVSMPGLHAVRATTTSLHTGMKEHYGVGRIEHGNTEWWGAGRVWRSAPGCILVKQPGDVVRHLVHDGPTTFTAVTCQRAKSPRRSPERRWHRAARNQRHTRCAALISDAHVGRSRPVRRAMEYSANDSATRSRSTISRTTQTSTTFTCAAPFVRKSECRRTRT